jgi:FAD-dependent urate hydroxylase
LERDNFHWFEWRVDALNDVDQRWAAAHETNTEALAALEQRVLQDLEWTAHPILDWMPTHHTADGTPITDVLIVGAGQGGLALAFALTRERVHNIRVIDSAPRGQEGAWRTYARMPTLRSPKDYTGPDLGVASLTYRAWHEAGFGVASWQAMKLIPTQYWADYLDWFRDVLNLPVQNEQCLVDVEPHEDYLTAHVQTPGGLQKLPVRKLVLASGQDGAGRWWMPETVATLPEQYRAHCAQSIDFVTLRGRDVVVIGAGASAADSAVAALQYGARVRMLCRRPELQVVQPYRWLTFAGFLRHLSDLDDLSRWRFMSRILGLREGIPPDTYERLMGFDNFALMTGTALESAVADVSGVRLTTTAGVLNTDFVISGTGIDIDFAARPELRRLAHTVRTWAHAFTPPSGEENERLGRYAYLGPDQELMERVPGEAPYLSRIHDFTFGATMSFGASGCSINAMKIAVPKLASALTRGLFREDAALHYQSLMAYEVTMYTPRT